MSLGHTNIVGFDLGHGETALAWTNIGATGEPAPLEVKNLRSIITAVCVDRCGDRIRIGREVISSHNPSERCYIRFKNSALDNHEYAGKATRWFVRGVIEDLEKSNRLPNLQDTQFFVGCPSGWSPAIQRLYEKLLSDAGLRMVYVVPESRAAMLHARETGHLSTEELLSKRVLVIDVGSSTTDFTFASKLNARPLDIGHTEIGDIGAGIIDQAIVDHVIRSANDRERLLAALAESPGKKVELEIKCRDAKHEYFNEREGSEQDVEFSVRIHKGLYVEITLNDKIMDIILNAPLSELAGLSFRQAFIDRLIRVEQEIGGVADLIILTGGAARMGFIPESIRKVFPNSSLIRAKEPELAVARGLAWFGRSKFKAERFRHDVEVLIESDQVEKLVAIKVDRLFSSVAESLGKTIINDIVRREIIRWRDSKTKTLRGMERAITNSIDNFLRSGSGKNSVERLTREWFNEIRPEVQKLTDPICSRHHIDSSILQITPDLHFSTTTPTADGISTVATDDIDQVGTIISVVVATVVGMVLGGAGVALLALPLIGQILAGILAFIGLMIGKDAMMEELKDWDLPWFLRKLVSNSKIDNKLHESQPTLTAGILQSLRKAESDAAQGTKLADRLSKQIDAALKQRIDDAILRF